MNSIYLVGRAGKDAVMRQTGSGTAVASFSLATTQKFKDKEETEWHNVILWGKTAEINSPMIKKGALVSVQGRMKYRQWEKDGVKRDIAEVNAQWVVVQPKMEQKAAPAPQDEIPDFDDVGF